MDVIATITPEELARRAADLVQEYLRGTPAPVLGLATGGSVRGLYRELVLRCRRRRLTFSAVRAFLLDEYVGLGRGHPQLYANVIREQFARWVDIDPDRLHSPDAGAADLDRECARYEEMVTRAGVGLQILGLGRNGHLAFNEPGASFESRTRVVRLTEVTRADNARFFPGRRQAPSHAITQGLATIMQADHLLVLATGSPKAEAVEAALEGPVTPAVPASVLQLHPRVTLLIDPEAARLTRFRPGSERMGGQAFAGNRGLRQTREIRR